MPLSALASDVDPNQPPGKSLPSGQAVRLTLFIVAVLLFSMASPAQSYRSMTKLVEENFKLASEQYRIMMANTPDSVMPRNFNPKENKFVTSKTSWWTSGFYPGSLFYIAQARQDSVLFNEGISRLKILEKEKFHSSDHDLGFMIFNSFGNAYRITRNPEYAEVVMTAAQTLTRRYRPSINSIQSWDSNQHYRSPVIIDNMMNLEMLCWAADEIREPKLKIIAIDHTETAIRNHYRPDFSSYHVVDYNLQTGQIVSRKSAQGYSESSAWARGQSWGLYGFTTMYRFTREPRYLEQAKGIAKFILNHPRLPKDKIPYWDFDAPDIPDTYRDVSAASILASGLLELSLYVDQDLRNEYVSAVARILTNLSTDKYRSKKGENGGFILKHSVGAVPYNSEVDVSLTYADYYFLEALSRFWKWYLTDVTNYNFPMPAGMTKEQTLQMVSRYSGSARARQVRKGEWIPLDDSAWGIPLLQLAKFSDPKTMPVSFPKRQ
ncbi:MAG: glucuronyl hydrolase [Chitinophagaceae bacterium]|nr:MAG: glucuronyl hydrolase [Chitinophagaceae bacterium]